MTRSRTRMWERGLFALIAMFYVGAYWQQTIAWLPATIFVFYLIWACIRSEFGGADFYHLRWYIVLVLWMFLSYVWTVDRDSTIGALRNFVPKVIIVLYAFKFQIDDQKKTRCLGLFVVAILCAITIDLLTHFGTVRMSYQDKLDYGVSYANIIAAGLVAFLPILIFSKRNATVLVTGAVLLSMLVIVITESRAGFVFALFGIGLSISFRKSIRVSRWVSGAIAAIFLVGCAFLFVQQKFPDVADRLMSIPNTLAVLQHDSLSDIAFNANDYARKVQLVFTIEEVKRIPFFGLGYGAFAAALERRWGYPIPAHSFVGNFFVELGLIGFIIFITFQASLFRQLLRNANRADEPERGRAARMMLVALLVVNLLYFSRPQMAEVTYSVVLGLALAASRGGVARLRQRDGATDGYPVKATSGRAGSGLSGVYIGRAAQGAAATRNTE